ncbi:MAG: hypothetical protein ACW99U_21495 [Candidatus Thorarchaeota archaeon]|jgi:hypothetical protein
MPYEADKDIVLRDFGTYNVNGYEYSIKFRQYNGGEPKLVVEGSFRGKPQRMKGVPLWAMRVLQDQSALAFCLNYAAEALEMLPEDAEPVTA